MNARGRRGDRAGPLAARILAAATLLLCTSSAIGQTIRPVIVEHRKHRISSRFELVNDGLTPLNVVLEPQSFDITDGGEPVYRPLDPRIHLRLSAMSLRIPARQTRYVFYEASVDSLPAWFVIPCTFSGMRTASGLQVRVELPHTVYLVQSEPLSARDVTVPIATFDAAARSVQREIENHGPRLGRAIEAVVIGADHRQRNSSFPLIPGGHRLLRIPWEKGPGPERVVIRFPGFTIERPLTETVQAGG